MPASSWRRPRATLGPTNFTVAHPSPWITTVAAGTHNRTGNGSVHAGEQRDALGAVAGHARRTGTADRLDHCRTARRQSDRSSACASPRQTTAARRCSIRPRSRGRSSSAIAASTRGWRRVSPFGMPAASGCSWSTSLPTARTPTSTTCRRCTCRTSTAPRVKTYAATMGPTAKINQSTLVFNVPAPFTAAFSSRGPLRALVRSHQAGRHRSWPGHHRGRRAARKRWALVQHVQRHVDVQSARRGTGCAAQGRCIRAGRR